VQVGSWSFDGIWCNNVPKFLFTTLSSVQILNIQMNNEWKTLNKCNNNFNVVKAYKVPNKKKRGASSISFKSILFCDQIPFRS
jgi:hypothetical protein